MAEVETSETDTDSIVYIRPLRVGIVGTLADLLDDLKSSENVNGITISAKSFLAYFQICIRETPRMFLPLENSNHEGEGWCEFRGFCKWVYTALGVIMVKPSLISIHAEMRRLLEELLDMIALKHTDVLRTALKWFFHILEMVVNVNVGKDANYKLEVKWTQSQRVLQASLNMIPEVNIENLVQIHYKYWHLLEIDKTSSGIDLLNILTTVFECSSVPRARKVALLEEIPSPLLPRSESVDTSYQWLLISILRDPLLLDYETAKQFLSLFLANEVQDRNVTLGKVFIEDLQFYLELRMRSFDDCSGSELTNIAVNQKYIRILYSAVLQHKKRSNVPRNLSLPQIGGLAIEDRLLNNSDDLESLGDVIVDEVLLFIQSHNRKNLKNLTLNMEFHSPQGIIRKAGIDFTTMSTSWQKLESLWIPPVVAVVGNPMQNQPTLTQSSILFGFLSSTVQKLTEVNWKSKLNSKWGAASVEGKLVIRYFDAHKMETWILSCYRQLCQANTREIKQALMLHLCECCQSLSALDVPHYEMLHQGQTKDLIRILVSPLYKGISSPVFQAHKNRLAEGWGFYERDTDYEKLLTVKRIESLVLPIFRSDEALVTKILTSLMKLHDEGCSFGFLKMLGSLESAALNIGASEKELMDFLYRTMGYGLWKGDNDCGLALASVISLIPCILSRFQLKRESKEEPSTANGCFVCKNEKLCARDSVKYMPKLAKFCKIIMEFGCDEINEVVLRILRTLRKHGIGPKPCLISAFVGGISNRMFRKQFMDSLPDYLNDPRAASKDVEECGEIFFSSLSQYVKQAAEINVVSTNPDSASHSSMRPILDVLSDLQEMAQQPYSSLSVRVAQQTCEILSLRWNSPVTTLCRTIFQKLAISRGVSLGQYVSIIRNDVAPSLVECILHRVFGSTILFNRRNPKEKEALDKCEAVLRGIEFAMELRRENFIRDYFPAFLRYLIPKIETDGRKLLMIRGLANLGSENVKTLLELHFPVYYSTLAMQHPVKDVNSTLVYLRSLGIEPEISASIQIQSLMNEMISYWSIDKRKMFSYFKSLLLWAEGKGHKIPTSQNLGKEEIMDFISSRLMGYHVYLDCKMYNELEGIGTKRRILSSFTEVIIYMGKERMSGSKMRVFNVLNTLSGKPYLQDLLLRAWKAYVYCLEDSALSSLMNQVLASVLFLQKNKRSKEFEQLAKYFVVLKKEHTSLNVHTVYYLEPHFKDAKTREVISAAKYRGMQFFVFLIGELAHANTHVRYQALLAVRNLIRGRNTTLNVKSLLESTQLIHPIICRLIVALLDCAHSQDQAVKSLSVSLFGELGALDYYRMKLKAMDRRSRRDPTEIFTTGLKFALRLFEVLRRQYQGTEIRVPENVDICAYSIQELLRVFKVEESDDNPVWKGMSVESRVIFQSLLKSHYRIRDIIPLDDYPSPIYGSECGINFQDWCNNFILQLYTFIRPESQTKEIIRCILPILVRSLPIATHFLPYVAIYAALDGTDAQRQIIFKELSYIMKLWVGAKDGSIDIISTQHRESVRKSQASFGRDRRRRKLQHMEPEQMVSAVKDRVAVTNASFTVIDMITYIARYGTRDFATVNAIATTGRPDGFRSPREEDSVKDPVLDASKIKSLFCVTPDPRFMARAAFHTESYHRALMNLEEFLSYFPEEIQRYLPFLQRIYVALEDFDSLVGVAVKRKHKPTLVEDILEKLATGNSEEAAAKFRIKMQTGFSDFMSEHALVQAYISIEQPQMAITILNGLSRRGVDVGSTALGDCRLEACWKLQKWTELSKILQTLPKDKRKWNTNHAGALLQIKQREYDAALKTIRTAKAQSMTALAGSPIHINSYHTRYGEMTRLHVLTEMEQAIDLLKFGQGRLSTRKLRQFSLKARQLLSCWDDRLAMVQNSITIVEPILNTRKALLSIMKDNAPRKNLQKLFVPPICDAWIHVAKMESKSENYVRAYNCIQESRRFKSAEGLIQEAKLLGKRNDMDRGISVLHDCIKQFFSKKLIVKWKGKREDAPFTQHQVTCSKALLLLAKFNDEKCNVDIEVNIRNYEQATEVFKRSEKNFFHLANYYDSVWSTLAAECRQKKVEMQTSVVQYYCKSLLYGCKHIHQSLPRLLFIWFDYGAEKPDNGGSKKLGQASVSALATYNAVVKEMTQHIATLFQRVPPYVFLTGFSQLISRICHCNLHIWTQLKYMIVQLILAHPHQALWMMMAVSKSSYARRKERCNEIFKEVEAQQSSKKAMIQDYTTLAEKLIELANKNVNERLRATPIENLVPNLPKLLSKSQFSRVIVPFQQFLCVSLPRVPGNHLNYDAFPQDAVYIVGMERMVDVMPSLQRPKKINLRGSDGKLYGLMCKPTDDLRKDSKVMEMNNVVNWYLARTASTRERSLHIHTYAVVPLNEETGLLEWVPNLSGLRQVLNALYKERKAGIDGRNLRGMAPNQTASIEEKIRMFKDNYLRRHPPLLREWFLNTFSDPQEWYMARMSYTRSAAVMSIVGYIMGLGDRHGENILLDSSTGEVVHVDFNCLFNKGQGFQQPERVPFRLTQNMVDAMGPLGYEGVFRRSCENTLRVLRDNSNVFISILRPFVNDPLVEWTRQGREKESGTGEVQNVKAVEHLSNIRSRLTGVSRNNTKALNVALSVEAQVKHLINEATSLENLSQMYIGWGAYL